MNKDNIKLEKYILYTKNKKQGSVVELTRHEAAQKNYAFRMNRTDKRYVKQS